VVVWFGVVLVAGGMSAGADSVRLVTRADGSKLIVNEGSGHRSRRLSDRLVHPDDPLLAQLIAEHAAALSLEPKLVQAVIQVESGYNPRALSNKGAMGLMQLMPGTARDLAVADPWDPGQNIRGGTSYLRRLLDQFDGNEDLALAAYNAGPNAVVRHGGIPPYRETRDYVDRILRLCEQEGVAVLRAAQTASSTHASWAAAAGPARREAPAGPPVRMRRDARGRLVVSNRR
jgi:hypothetical protein